MGKKLLLSIGLVLLNLITFSQERIKYTINENWLYLQKNDLNFSSLQIDDSEWKSINIPHTYNDKDANDDLKGYFQGISWYRKKITVPSQMKDKRLFLYFEGVNQVANVYVNGQSVGEHIGGYSAFCFEVTNQMLKNGESNTIAVKVNNAYSDSIPPISADFTFYGGIYRDVFLVATDAVHFDMLDYASSGVYIKTNTVKEAEASIIIKSNLKNDLTSSKKVILKHTIFDPNENIVATNSTNISLINNTVSINLDSKIIIKNPKLWSSENPYLYKVVSTIIDPKTKKVLDKVVNPLGIRTFSFSPNEGLVFNGKSVKLMGVNRHQDFENKGNALTDNQHRKDYQLIKEMGANFVRIAHYPQDHSVLDECDKLGLMAWEETPNVNRIALNPTYWENSKLMMREMIRQHYNHPSVIIWGYMNEVLLQLYWLKVEEEKIDFIKKTTELAKEIEAVIRTEDPDRYSAIAFHYSDYYNTYGLADVPQIAGWNFYHGWYHDKFPDFGKKIDSEHQKYPNRIHVISEYGAGSDKRINSTNPEQYDFSIQYQQLYHETYTKQILERPFIAGATMWNLIDFGSEGRKESMPTINNKGLLYYNRDKKDIYYMYKAKLSKEKFVYIASRDWTLRTGTPADSSSKTVTQSVKVYSTYPEVEFYLNGVSLGSKLCVDQMAIFDVPFVSGRNLLGAKGHEGTDMYRDNLIIDFKMLPSNTATNFDEIAINVGSSAQFTDYEEKFTWQADKPYIKGNWGYVGGKILRSSKNRLGVQEKIDNTIHQPLFQTAVDSLTSYKIDVPKGRYEIELLLSDLVKPKKSATTIVNDIGANSSSNNVGKRVFDILINGQIVWEKLDLATQYGYFKAVKRKFEIETNGGIEIGFNKIAGNPILNGIRIRKM